MKLILILAIFSVSSVVGRYHGEEGRRTLFKKIEELVMKNNNINKGNSLEANSEYVWVKDTRSNNGKRTLGNEMPDELEMTLGTQKSSTTLKLKRNNNLNIDAPVSFQTNGKVVHMKNSPKLMNTAVYQDIERGAPVSVKRNSDGTYKLEGSFKNNEGKTISIRASASTSNNRRSLINDNQYVLHELNEITDMQDLSTDYQEEEAPAQVFMNSTSETESEFITRKKRSTSAQNVTEYHVELLFVLDYTVWEYFLAEKGTEDAALLEIKYAYSNILNGLDLAYKTIDPTTDGFSITPWLTGYHIAKTSGESSWTTDAITSNGATHRTTSIDGDLVLQNLGVFVSSNGKSWSNPDHAMLFTHFDLFGNSVVGYAPVSGICQYKRGTSVVEYRGFYTWTTAAHELGHNLGAKHDSITNTCSSSQYIMASSHGIKNSNTISDSFYFSKCSINYFNNLLTGVKDGYPRRCITNKVCKHGKPLQGVNTRPGVKYSLDQQCQLKKGTNYKQCYDNGEGVCQILYCSTAGSSCSGGSPGAANGSPCNIGKICYQGLCINEDAYPKIEVTGSTNCTATGISTTVPAGCVDMNIVININNSPNTCAMLAEKYPSICFTWGNALYYCCKSCHLAGLV